MAVVFIFLFLAGTGVWGENVETEKGPMQHYDTIIVGLGAAGATAASELARAGKRVLALEAQDRIGGRVKTVPFAGGVVEEGAEWIHGTTPSRVFDAAVKNNITIKAQDLTFEVYRSDGSLADKNLVEELTEYSFMAAQEPGDSPEPLGRLVTRRLMEYIEEKHPELQKDKDFAKQLLEYIQLLMNNYEAANSWNDISSFSKYEELEGHQHLSWHKYGYKTFFEILLNTYNKGPGLPTLTIKLNTEVVKIEWPEQPDQNVRVTCANGDVYTARTVIVTVSLGVLKERHTALFSPPLPPEKVQSIDRISIGVMDKIILSFDEPWWPKKEGFYGFIWRTEDLRWQDHWVTRIFGVSSPAGSEKALTVWTSGDVGKLVETLPEDIVIHKCMELIRRFMGKNITIPEPTGMIRSTWYTNPFTRGSYSHDNLLVADYPKSRLILSEPLLDKALKPRVLFAGEATDETHFSTVHGASDTGYREAHRLLNSTSKL